MARRGFPSAVRPAAVTNGAGGSHARACVHDRSVVARPHPGRHCPRYAGAPAGIRCAWRSGARTGSASRATATAGRSRQQP